MKVISNVLRIFCVASIVSASERNSASFLVPFAQCQLLWQLSKCRCLYLSLTKYESATNVTFMHYQHYLLTAPYPYLTDETWAK